MSQASRGRHFARRNLCEVDIYCEARGNLLGGMVVTGALCLVGGFYVWLTCPRSRRSRSDEEVGAKGRASLLAQRSNLRCQAGVGMTCWRRVCRVDWIGIERTMRLQAFEDRA